MEGLPEHRAWEKDRMTKSQPESQPWHQVYHFKLQFHSGLNWLFKNYKRITGPSYWTENDWTLYIILYAMIVIMNDKL